MKGNEHICSMENSIGMEQIKNDVVMRQLQGQKEQGDCDNGQGGVDSGVRVGRNRVVWMQHQTD